MAVYKDKDAKTGDVRWRYRFSHNGRRYSGSTPDGGNTKAIALKLERRHIDRVIAHAYTGKMPTVREFSERFLAHQKERCAPLTHIQQSATMNEHVVPSIGPTPLDRVSKEMIDGLVTKWAASSMPKTVNTRLGAVRRMLSLATEWEIIPKVPRIRFLRVPETTPRWLTDVEANSLLLAAEPKWKAMVMVALRTGLRVGELRGLQWGDVDFARRVIQVKRTDPGRKTLEATPPKGKRERTVPLTNDALDALKSLRPAKPLAQDWVWPALLRRSKETRARCRSEKGCWAAITRAAQRAGLEDVGWHTLRHTYASQLVMRNIPIRTIQKWMGHASVKETEKYSHLSPDFGHEAANLLDHALSPESACQPPTNQLPAPSRERSDNRPLRIKGR